ncbi:MAG TPA: hypothetical protein PLR44_04510 [Thermomicrobiales bacterium]|nr:hypothetical protein [Thermomicrobiales bacterium]HRA31705.1 hypothetical protein [Thermomicrobiales bacterium]
MALLLIIPGAVAAIPLSIFYYLWIGRRVAPRVAWLPIPVGMTVVAGWVVAPWVVLLGIVWLMA